ncbi:MAG TPA: hypothetical protein VEV87_02355 [Chitinophagaceae bacterium]|nr:hypothetical protein [Chitinophagaceae bacterium]
MDSHSIRHVSHANIDVQKWDQCINSASNGLIYAYSFYLDRMAKHWDALVLDDYVAVMPLTWNKKAGLYYLFQPAFTPSLGVFGNRLDGTIVKEFILSIPGKFRLIDINLNAENNLEELNHPFFHSIIRKNYVLPLKRDYNQLYTNFSENIKRNIKRSVAFGCIVKKDIPINDVVKLAKDQLSNLTNLKEQDFENFTSLYGELSLRKQACTYGILHNNQLLSSAVYFFSNGRAYYILVGNHPNGKTMGTSHYLIDRFIADHAGNDLILDFEGSDISSLAFFYSSFGSTPEYYPALLMNRLPWYVRWRKKSIGNRQ